VNKIFLTGIKNIVIKIAYANTFNQTQANICHMYPTILAVLLQEIQNTRGYISLKHVVLK